MAHSKALTNEEREWLIGEYFFFSRLCGGKAMVAYIKPQHRKKKESEGRKKKASKWMEVRSNLLTLGLKGDKS